MKPAWHPLTRGGRLNTAILFQCRGRGAFAVRERVTRVVLEVGAASSVRRALLARGPRDVDTDVALAMVPDADAQARAWQKSLMRAAPAPATVDVYGLVTEWPHLNPDGVRRLLGHLTRLTYLDAKGKECAIKWGLRRAPQLAYDERGRLFIVYVSGRAVRAATGDELADYERTHWGQQGKGVVRAGGVATPPFRRLGAGVAIVYTTAKSSGDLKDWIHPWGEGGKGRFTPPTVLVHACQKGAKCAAHGRVCLHGGTYRVTAAGIVG